MKLQHRLLTALFTLLLTTLGTTTAQHDPEALEWLERAYDRHGGEAFRELHLETPWVMHDRIDILSPGGGVMMSMTSTMKIDPLRERSLIATRMGDHVVLMQLEDAGSYYSWAPHTGRLRLPRPEERTRQEEWFRGVLGLARGVDGRDSVTIERDFEIAGVRGTLLRVVTNGIEGLYVLDDDGTVLAEPEGLTSGSDVVLYEDYREIRGVLVPFVTRMRSIEGTMRIELVEYELDVAFEDEDFALP